MEEQRNLQNDWQNNWQNDWQSNRQNNPQNNPQKAEVTEEEMREVYEEMRTPVKYGMVLCEEGADIDCANVIRLEDGTWRMLYARHVPGQGEREGYETWMAKSEDLLHWEVEGKVLSQKESGWDCLQADGGFGLLNPQWEGAQDLEKYDGKYWITYIGGSLPGYETDPLQIGLAWSEDLEPDHWVQEENPILRMDDADAREFERATLYKSTIVHDTKESLGYPFVMYYNAKQKGVWVERIGMAVSKDMKNWQRYGEGAVVDMGIEDRWNISGDPQIIRYKNLWVMHYFVGVGAGAYDTFACSKDLVNWKKWEGEPLIQPSEDYDKTFAHKPYVLKYNGKVYHFYCAVGDQGRGIALAVSE